MISALQKYNIDIQRLNGLRFECYRQVSGNKQMMNQLAFYNMFKLYGITIPLESRQDFLQMMEINAPPKFYNLSMLNKIF